MIDWTRLKPYHHDKRKSFEQLCFQVAKKIHGSLGRFTPIDDSGGGDGVEFFLTLPDGTEWGWQAKFYFPQPRLNNSRKRSILQSLSTSKQRHTRLTKWFLCTPTDLVVTGQRSELRWFEETLGGAARDVEVVHWGDSEFSEMLSGPQMTGKYNYFFGDFELSPDWFARQVHKQLVRVRDKFYPSLHTETAIDFRVHSLLGDDTLQNSFCALLGQVAAELSGLNSVTKEMQALTSNNEWRDLTGLTHIVNEFNQVLTTTSTRIFEFQSLIKEGRIEEALKSDFSAALARLHGYIEAYEGGYRALLNTKIKTGDDLSEADKSANESAHSDLNKIYKPLASAESLAALISLSSSRANDFRNTDLHIFGEAGTGKTHLVCHICDDRTNSNLPVILFHGDQLSVGQTIENKILEVCDVPATYNWQTFLAALESYAEACGAKVLIAIDSLNEASSVEVWRQGMASFISDLARSPWIALITTCRTTYQLPVWNETLPSNRVYLRGFDSDSLEEAMAKTRQAFKS